jgi:hypothetical protein
MKYIIQITYDTGDSFNHYIDLEEPLYYQDIDFKQKLLCFDDLNIGKENLRRIYEHYTAIQDIERTGRFEYTAEEIKQKKEEIKQKDWFDVTGDWKYKIFLLNDKKEKIYVSAFWCGYFETLRSAEIKLNQPDMDGIKINF